ncbi:MAG: DUF4268 domain-containing protein [Acidimicrobiales bacterium]|nr:DUF4268 domain-containing protein [Acidimicrobiales bacterium]MYD33934.1 DUF4268 domain-containing protein [Acidimicrobiales bacterium]MYI09900.1 DUF4268 domain-containing protein [Acidimicrobiales bacterium]
MVEVASLEEVPLREVWPDEAKNFTPWLAEHPDHLGKALQMDLELEDKEVAVGSFSADVVFRDTNTDRRLVVENFLEATDHDHLGKLITYAAGLEAHWAVLVAKSFRPEHRSALNWLNRLSDESSGFFGIEVHAVRISDSPAAVQLDVVVEPDGFSRSARAVAKSVSALNAVYLDWWAAFLPAFNEAHPDWSNARRPQPANSISLPSGRSGVRYRIGFAYPAGAASYSLRASVFLRDGGSSYPALETQRATLDDASALDLQWEPLEDAKASRIAVYSDAVDPEDREKWPQYRAWAIEALGELRRVFAEPIRSLP